MMMRGSHVAQRSSLAQLYSCIGERFLNKYQNYNVIQKVYTLCLCNMYLPPTVFVLGGSFNIILTLFTLIADLYIAAVLKYPQGIHMLF